MKFRILLGFVFVSFISFSQNEEKEKRYTLDANQFYGSIMRHSPNVSHLLTSHQAGVILSLNRKTYGYENWEQRYNYPDLGYSFIYQEFNNDILGRNFGVYAHYNFYFIKRFLQLRLGQGIAYNTNPYDKETNFRNNVFGSHILSSTYLMLNLHKENIVKGVGFKAGISIIHYSNANVKAPNKSTNTFAFNAGVTYDLDGGKKVNYIDTPNEKNTEPFKFNFAFRFGINESDVVGSGQYPFYIFSGYVDKRVGTLSAIQLGTELFLSNFLKEYVTYRAIAFPEGGIDADDDYKRVGVFVGHELFFNKTSIITQLGYYVYYPFEFEGRVYNRVGMKRYFKNKIYGVVSLKSHGAKAEAVEFGVGIRL